VPPEKRFLISCQVAKELECVQKRGSNMKSPWLRVLFASLLVLLSPGCRAGFAQGLCYPCHRVSTPPKIDGVVETGEWAAGEWMVLTDVVTGNQPEHASSASLLWDDDRLYLAFRFADTNVWARTTERDSPGQPGFKAYTENFATVYLDPDGDGRDYVEMHFSPAGAINDKWQTAPWRGDARRECGIPENATAEAHWESNCEGMRSAVAVEGSLNDPRDKDSGWNAEVAIPFSAMKRFSGRDACPPRVGAAWRVLIGRRHQVEAAASSAASYWTWPVLGAPNCHLPSRWGRVVFLNGERGGGGQQGS
jgi:hypothetical protein